MEDRQELSATLITRAADEAAFPATVAFTPFDEWHDDADPDSSWEQYHHANTPNLTFDPSSPRPDHDQDSDLEGVITPPASNSRSSTPFELVSRRNLSTQGIGTGILTAVGSKRRSWSPSRANELYPPKMATTPVKDPTKGNPINGHLLHTPSTVVAHSISRSSSISPRTAINMPVIEMRRSSSSEKSSLSPRGRPYSMPSNPYLAQLHSLYSRFRHFLRSLDQSHAWLALYLTCAISQTISNKTLLRSFFPFPWLLTVCQMIWGTIGTLFASRVGFYRTVRLSPRKETILYAIGLLFSIELLASNVSLRLVAVPYHLSVRALSPLVTLLFSVLFFRQQTSLRTSSCLLLVALGVGFTSHSLEIISLGSLLTILSMLLSSAKSIITSRLLFDKYKLHPLDLLSRMSLLGIGPGLLFAVGNGELGRLWEIMGKPDEFTKAHLMAIGMNGALSFFLFVVTLAAERNTKPPLMGISTHVAQAITVVVAVFLFGLSLSLTNFIGVGLTLSGGVLYARNEALDAAAVDEDRGSPEEKLLPD